jgi:hypothetical protein
MGKHLAKHIADAVSAFGWPPLQPLPVAIKYTGRSRWTIRRAIADGSLKVAGRQGRSPVFAREDLDRWLLGQTEGNVPDLSPAPRRAASSSVTNADAIAAVRSIAKPGA